ncbi:CBO0543 family protein [Neobacillus sp. SM06]|uniref:CBO0543 family protein n=1 Tax=Neobacillus sp. SM06 TaxID=3422492 RepID=UPI003D26FF37
MLPALLFSVLFGTYLDLLMSGKHLYVFLNRPFPDIFSINIFYLLIILPVVTAIFLSFMERWNRLAVLLIAGWIMQFMEQFAELLGLFRHSESWIHANTFVGSLFFLTAVYAFHRWINA